MPFYCLCDLNSTDVHDIAVSLFLQLIRTIDMGYRMPPPSGCPRAIYETMISAWYVTLMNTMCVSL